MKMKRLKDDGSYYEVDVAGYDYSKAPVDFQIVDHNDHLDASWVAVEAALSGKPDHSSQMLGSVLLALIGAALVAIGYLAGKFGWL